MKHSTNVFTIDRDYATNLQNKLEAYQELSKDKRTLHLVMVTTNGVAHNNNYNMIQNEVTMDDLFTRWIKYKNPIQNDNQWDSPRYVHSVLRNIFSIQSCG